MDITQQLGNQDHIAQERLQCRATSHELTINMDPFDSLITPAAALNMLLEIAAGVIMDGRSTKAAQTRLNYMTESFHTHTHTCKIFHTLS